MENTRNALAEKMEIVGQLFEIEGMEDLLRKFEPEKDEDGNSKPTSIVKFNAVTIQISALLLRNNKALADKILALNPDMDDEKVQEMDDAAYASALRTAVTRDMLGFFGSSPRSDGKK